MKTKVDSCCVGRLRFERAENTNKQRKAVCREEGALGRQRVQRPQGLSKRMMKHVALVSGGFSAPNSKGLSKLHFLRAVIMIFKPTALPST